MASKSITKSRILYLTYHPQIGGGETILLSLIEKLDRKRFEPIVVATKSGQLADRLKQMRVKTHVLDLNGYLIRNLFIPGASPIGIYKLNQLIKKIKPDLIHLNHLNLTIYTGFAAKISRIPTIATAHGSWDTIYFYQDLITSLFVDKVLANTPTLKKTFLKRNFISRRKVELVQFGIDTDKFRPADRSSAKNKLHLDPKDLIITIVGRLDPVKDHLTFLKAAALVEKALPSAKFLIVGSKLGDFTDTNNDYQIRFQRFLKENPVFAQKVIFTGEIANMPAVYQSTDILVSSSTAESFGLALAEAAACAVPVVSTNIGGQHLIVKDGQTGFLVPPKNPQALAQKIILLSKNAKLRTKFGQAARVHIQTNFNLDAYVKKVQNVYNQLLET